MHSINFSLRYILNENSYTYLYSFCYFPQFQNQVILMSNSDQLELKVKQPQSFGKFNQRSPQPIHSSFEIGQTQINKLKELEGQCKILHFELLKINYAKGIFFLCLMILSVIGLLFLKYYKQLRAWMFYTSIKKQNFYEATHIYIKGTDKNQSICKLIQMQFEQKNHRVFIFKHLRYQYHNGECFPLGLRYIDSIHEYNKQYISRGLDSKQVEKRQYFYGKNEHKVEVPNYFQYLFDIMTQPFFIFQYLVSLVYILENVAIFGVLMIIFGYLTTSINYILLYRSYGKIKETAQKQFQVKVLRNKILQIIYNVDLVCGDLYIPDGEIPCDSIILSGELFIDQASLTGESVPIPKFKLEDPSEVQHKNHWVFQGSMVKTKREGTLAMAVNTGFGSRRGQIIRKILTKIPRQPQFFKKLIYFLLQVMIVSFILYAATVNMMFGLDIQSIMIFFRFLDFITYSFPAPLPIFFNLTYSFCLVRLHRDGIYGTQSEKTIESSRMKILCFDKTGTLTQNGMKVSQIYTVGENKTMIDVTKKIGTYSLINDIFACCHSVQEINGQYQGDQIDLKMFHYVKANINPTKSQNVIRNINIQDRTHEILRINQYESRFQSMSVLFRHKQSNKYFIVAKGSPQMIHNCSKYKINNFDTFIKKKSLQGYRSIGFGYRQISEKQVQNCLKLQRNEYLNNINILGVVTFENLLKDDAQSTIRTLTECQINTKIITGDNIFLGVQTAIMTGMIPISMKIIVIQGGKCKGQGSPAYFTQLQKLPSGQIQEDEGFIEKFTFSENSNIAYAIDNDFIKNNPSDFLHNRIKVFARITPQNKALIVRKHKQIISSKIKTRSYFNRIMGETSLKVGMVGDGANDLIAIKDADVGIGISSSDAVYSASFAVKDLSQIIEIICESKNTERQIVDMTQYFCIVNFISITSTIILTLDSSYSTSYQQIYKNFITTILLTLFFAFSRPTTTLSKYLPNSNFMGLQNHLIFWSSCAILGCGQLGAYFYYYNTDDFIPNPKPKVTFADGWNGICKSSTINFLITILEFTFLPIFIYRSSPWKQILCKNIPLFLLIVVNVCMIIPIFFFTENFWFIDLQTIGRKEAAIVLAIVAGACLICGGVNFSIDCARMHERVVYDEVEVEVEEGGEKRIMMERQ